MNANNEPAAQRDHSHSRNSAPPGISDGGEEGLPPSRTPLTDEAASHASGLSLAEEITVEPVRTTTARESTRTANAPGSATAADNRTSEVSNPQPSPSMPQRTPRTADRRHTKMKRSPSLPTRLEALSPRAQLHSDVIITAELEVRGTGSRELLQVMSMHLVDKCREIEGAVISPDPAPTTSVAALQPPPTPTRCPRPSDGAPEEDATPKRPCVQTQRLFAPSVINRDPRFRNRVAQGEAPLAAPPAPFTASATVAPGAAAATGQSSFADVLRAAGATLASTTAAQNTQAPSGTTAAAPATVKKPRFPPLVAYTFPNWTRHFQTLRDRIGHAPNARPYDQGVRFTPASEQEYRIIQRYLLELEKSERLSWFVYALPSEKSKKVAIRGLLASTPPEDIILALRELGYQAEYVRPIRARMGRPGCIFFAILTPTENLLPGIYGVTEFLNMPGITIEAWRSKKGPAQCHRCQAFRHSSHGCHRRMACVRCGGEHPARECPRPREEPATCANCGGPHPANHTACPQYKREVRNKKAGTTALTKVDHRARGKPQQKTAPAAPNMVAAEQQAQTLMAPANPATERGRRRKKRGGAKRGAKHPPPFPAATTTPGAPAATTAPSATTGTKLTASTNQQSYTPQPQQSHERTLVDKAIETLQNVLTAVREGGDPMQVVVAGMAGLMELLK